MQDGNNFFFADIFEVTYLLATDMKKYHCDVVQLPGIYLQLPKGMVFQKDSELKPIFDFYLRLFMQTGKARTGTIDSTGLILLVFAINLP